MIDKINFKEVESNAMYCIHCGLCRHVLPSEIKSNKYGDLCPPGSKFLFESYFAPGRCEIARGILRKEFTYEDSPKLQHIIYTCTNCGACSIQCRYCTTLGRTQASEIVEALRAKMVLDGAGPMPKHKVYGKSIQDNYNPYQEKHSNRLKWLGSEKTPEKADILYFVGCTSSYRTQEIALATYNILKNLNLNVAISRDEHCCGSPLLRTGQLDEAEAVMEHNIDLIKKTGAKKLIFSCAGCYRTFKLDYPKYFGDLGIECKHISQELAELAQNGKLKLNKLNLKVTYHDPCHIGRHMWPECVYNEPRNVLTAIPGLELIEMERIKDEAWCCGAGGGVKSAFPEFALDTSKIRIDEATKTGADTIVSTCPFCAINLNDAIKETKSNLKIYDLTQIVNISMGGGVKNE